MVAFFITTLVLSIVGMLALLFIKSYELSSGKLFLAPVRPTLASFFERMVILFNRILPAMARHYMRQGLTALIMRTRNLILSAVGKIERVLEEGLEIVRERAESLPQGEPSAFFRQVSEHKKSLKKPE